MTPDLLPAMAIALSWSSGVLSSTISYPSERSPPSLTRRVTLPSSAKSSSPGLTMAVSIPLSRAERTRFLRSSLLSGTSALTQISLSMGISSGCPS